MTTEPRPRPARAHPDAGRDLRLYLIALLALVYLLAWWALRPPGPLAVAPAPTPPSVDAAMPASLVPAARDARPVPVRAPARRTHRVRTRSS